MGSSSDGAERKGEIGRRRCDSEHGIGSTLRRPGFSDDQIFSCRSQRWTSGGLQRWTNVERKDSFFIELVFSEARLFRISLLGHWKNIRKTFLRLKSSRSSIRPVSMRIVRKSNCASFPSYRIFSIVNRPVATNIWPR